MKYKALLFDFDGTLANTTPGIVSTLRESFLRMNRPVPTEEAMVATIGLPLWKAFQQLGNMTDEEAQRAVGVYTDLFMEYEIPRVDIFPTVAETLQTLSQKGLRMAIVTSRDSRSLRQIIEHRSVNRFFETHVTIDDHLPSKPAPDMVLALLERMKLTAADCLVIGDTTFDIEMGNRAGCDTCAVTYGNHSRQQLETVSPTYIIDNFEALADIV